MMGKALGMLGGAIATAAGVRVVLRLLDEEFDQEHQAPPVHGLPD